MTIYRIGGADQPPPQLEHPFEFVQLPWGGLDADLLGESKGLEIQADFIAPLQLDPSVNLVPFIADHGGQITSFGDRVGLDAREEAMVDGDVDTAFLGQGNSRQWWAFFNRRENQWVWPSKFWVFDLGVRLFLEKIRFYPRDRFHFERFVQTFSVGASDGDVLKEGTRDLQVWKGPDFDLVHQVSQNRHAVVEVSLPPVPVRQLFLELRQNKHSFWEIAEIELYATGFSASGHYTSNIIDLGQALNVGVLSWMGHQPAGSQVELRARLGDDPDPIEYRRYTFRGDEETPFDSQGQPLTRATYARLESGERAGTAPDTRNWIDWSVPFAFGTPARGQLGDKPRRFIQLKAEFSSTIAAGGRLQYLQFAVSEPLVAQVLAEIVPVQVMPGVPTDFTYTVLPSFDGKEPGFDRVAIDTPAQVLSVNGVRVDGVEVGFTVEALDEKGFVVGLPHIDASRSNEQIAVDFSAEVFQLGTPFTGRVANSDQPHEVAQALVPGDADPLAGENTLKVDLAVLGPQWIRALRLTPPSFTPNGDGINDRVQIEYDLVNLGGASPVTLTVYDLSGRKRHQIQQRAATSGRFRAIWDGADEGEKRLSPGLYILQLEVKTDRGRQAVQRLVTLAY